MKRFRFLNLFVVVSMALVLFGPGAQAANAGGGGVIFTVQIVNEGHDAHPGDGVCATASGSCTLRAAIEESNANPDYNTIQFNLPGGGVHVMSITLAALPAITSSLTLDGISQPNCSAPCIVLSGANLAGTNSGLRLLAGNSLVRGFIITSWSFDGINISSDGNTVQANDIGYWPGLGARPNGYGIEIQGSNNLIGGSGAATRNVISGNTYEGIAIARSGGTAAANKIQGNYIGTDANGTAAVANGHSGIIVYWAASNTLIGGGVAGQRNVISGNTWRGVDSGAPGTKVQGNYIGTNAAGNAALGNASGGMYIDGGPATVGGGSAAASNLIAYNNGIGIYVYGSSTRVNMRRNSFRSNAALAIDLGGDGVTPNDTLDADSGPNGYQNFPIISSATSGTGSVVVTLRSQAGQVYKLDFYSSPSGTCDPSHYGEGKKWIGMTSFTTDVNGYWHGTVAMTLPFLAGEIITATATDTAGRTSEFSACRVSG